MIRPFIDSVRQLRRETRVALAHRRTMRHALGRAFRLTLQAHRESVIASVQVRRWPASRSPGTDPPDQLARRVRQVIERHPDGIDLRDIGNELGRDWRQVMETVRALVATGVVEQIDQEYYPAQKASRRW
jgi:hypothetical protein